jgi:hypothetical protein
VQRALDLESVAIPRVVHVKIATEPKRSLCVCLLLEFPFLRHLFNTRDQNGVSADDLRLLDAAIARHRHFDKLGSRNARLSG